jgi:hypothetical protein
MWNYITYDQSLRPILRAADRKMKIFIRHPEKLQGSEIPNSGFKNEIGIYAQMHKPLINI